MPIPPARALISIIFICTLGEADSGKPARSSRSPWRIPGTQCREWSQNPDTAEARAEVAYQAGMEELLIALMAKTGGGREASRAEALAVACEWVLANENAGHEWRDWAKRDGV